MTEPTLSRAVGIAFVDGLFAEAAIVPPLDFRCAADRLQREGRSDKSRARRGHRVHTFALIIALASVGQGDVQAPPDTPASATPTSEQPQPAAQPAPQGTAQPPPQASPEPAPPPRAQAEARTRLVILDLTANDVDAALVKTVNDTVAVALQKAKIVDDVVTAADLRAMMNIEATKVESGACDVSESCMAELAQALGADVLIHGSVGRLGQMYAVNLNLFDAKANRAIAREKAEATRLESLSKRIEHAAKRLALAYEGKELELAGAEPAEQGGGGSALLWAGVGVGALGAVGVVVGGVLAATAAATLEDPLSSGANKASAEASHPIFLAAAIGSGAVAAAGAGLVVTSFVME